MTDPDPLAVGAMIGYCGWDPTTVVTDTVQLDGNGTSLLTLPSLHVTAVALVTVTDRFGTVTTPTIGTGTSQVGWSENGCLQWNSVGVWPYGQRNIEVTFTGGYDYIPDDLDAALASVSKRTSSPTFGATTRRLGTAMLGMGSQVSSGDFLATERMVFDRYRIMRAA